MWYEIQYNLRGLTVLCDMWSCDGLFVWFHICWLLFYDFMWYMKLSTWCGLALTYKTKYYDSNGKFIWDMQFYMIYLNWLNHVVCDYVTDSLCSLYMLAAMCMQCYDFMWFVMLSNWYMIMFSSTYMNKYIMCSLTRLRTCGEVLSDITPHASTLLSGPGYQDGGRSAWDTLMIEGDHLCSVWQYGTEISKPLFPIHDIYEYKYEYEYERSMNKIMSISASTKMRKFMLNYVWDQSANFH